jgi:small-conductance mechanosensitive channel
MRESVTLRKTVKSVTDSRITQVPNNILNSLWVDNFTRANAMHEQLVIISPTPSSSMSISGWKSRQLSLSRTKFSISWRSNILNSLWVDNFTRANAMHEQLVIPVAFDTSFAEVQLTVKRSEIRSTTKGLSLTSTRSPISKGCLTKRKMPDSRITQVPNNILNSLWVDNFTRANAMHEQLVIPVARKACR